MGELLIGHAPLAITFAAPVVLDVGLLLSLVHRAGRREAAAPPFDPWVEGAAAALAPDLADDLRLLLGFSGRRLSYLEEVVLAARPFDKRHLDDPGAALAALEELGPADFADLALRAIARARDDAGVAGPRPDYRAATDADRAAFVAPALTTAGAEEVAALLDDPARLKRRTLGMLARFWREVYAAEWLAQGPLRAAALARARALAPRALPRAFEEITGKRLPAELGDAGRLNAIARATFCPSAHLGHYLSYICAPPDLVVFFDAARLVARPAEAAPDDAAIVRALRALGDDTRLRIVRLLGGGELYAQEIVARLGSLSQSATSRHLGVLEDAGIVRVRPAGGVKYYALDRERLREIGAGLGRLA